MIELLAHFYFFTVFFLREEKIRIIDIVLKNWKFTVSFLLYKTFSWIAPL
jgi:hypothetical protein